MKRDNKAMLWKDRRPKAGRQAGTRDNPIGTALSDLKDTFLGAHTTAQRLQGELAPLRKGWASLTVITSLKLTEL